MKLQFQMDDLRGKETQALIVDHLRRMHAITPAGSVFALDLDKLRHPDIAFWSVWADGQLVGCGALKRLDAARGEVKSMRVVDEWLGKGVGRAILRHILEHARSSGLSSLWLETGTTEHFLPARTLYASEGFTSCGPFGDYVESPHNTFMMRAL